MNATQSFNLEALHAALTDISDSEPVFQLRHLVNLGLDQLPLPGKGATLTRWRALAAVAARDLSLAKVYEGHTDAIAILNELGHSALHTPGSLWGTWAAEAPQGRSLLSIDSDHGCIQLSGAKFWCSGAARVTHGLLTAWLPTETKPQLVSLAMNQPGIELDATSWNAVGMGDSGSVDLHFGGVLACPVGKPGDYLTRPGFWQGGAGVAACWYGGAQALAEYLRRAVRNTPENQRNEFRIAALGKVDLHLQHTAAILRAAAKWIDANSMSSAQTVALRARLSAEKCAMSVLDEVGRALGATPFCRNSAFARLAADLPVFVRQSHAERDFSALGSCVPLESERSGWSL